jgi:hypothetical protein
MHGRQVFTGRACSPVPQEFHGLRRVDNDGAHRSAARTGNRSYRPSAARLASGPPPPVSVIEDRACPWNRLPISEIRRHGGCHDGINHHQQRRHAMRRAALRAARRCLIATTRFGGLRGLQSRAHTQWEHIGSVERRLGRRRGGGPSWNRVAAAPSRARMRCPTENMILSWFRRATQGHGRRADERRVGGQ